MATPDKQLFIKFNDIKVKKLDAKFNGPDISQEYNILLNFEPVFYPDEKKNKDFALDFSIKIDSTDGIVSIDLSALAYFSTSEIITEEFKKSDWVTINAPAIAFPFLRSYVSTITLNSGVSPIILPAFNFTRRKKEGDAKTG
jgi:preprotein translocase subunit SecB